jgi:hypothetical protein
VYEAFRGVVRFASNTCLNLDFSNQRHELEAFRRCSFDEFRCWQNHDLHTRQGHSKESAQSLKSTGRVGRPQKPRSIWHRFANIFGTITEVRSCAWHGRWRPSVETGAGSGDPRTTHSFHFSSGFRVINTRSIR